MPIEETPDDSIETTDSKGRKEPRPVMNISKNADHCPDAVHVNLSPFCLWFVGGLENRGRTLVYYNRGRVLRVICLQRTMETGKMKTNNTSYLLRR